ncbi:MAG: hypothetical protein ACREMY_29065 [bacterium]
MRTYSWAANDSIQWRGALIGRAIERIEVFPGIGKPLVDVGGITMRFDKSRIRIIWRKPDSHVISAA